MTHPSQQCLDLLQQFQAKTSLLTLEEVEQLSAIMSHSILDLKKYALALAQILTRLNKILNPHAPTNKNFKTKQPSLFAQLTSENISSGIDTNVTLFFATLYSDLEFALRSLIQYKSTCDNVCNARDIYPELKNSPRIKKFLDKNNILTDNKPLLSQLKYIQDLIAAEFQAEMIEAIHTQVAQKKEPDLEDFLKLLPAHQNSEAWFNEMVTRLKLNDPRIQQYHYPEIASLLLTIYLVGVDLSASYWSGQIPYNVLQVLSQLMILQLTDQHMPAYFKKAIEEIVPAALYIGAQASINPQLPTITHASLSFLFLRGVRTAASFIPEKMSSKFSHLTSYTGQQILHHASSLFFNRYVLSPPVTLNTVTFPVRDSGLPPPSLS